MEKYTRIWSHRPQYPKLEGAALLLRDILSMELYDSTIEHDTTEGPLDSDDDDEEEGDDSDSSTTPATEEEETEHDERQGSRVPLHMSNLREAARRIVDGVMKYPDSWDAFATLAERFHKIEEYESEYHEVSTVLLRCIESKLRDSSHEEVYSESDLYTKHEGVISLAAELYLKDVLTTTSIARLFDLLMENFEMTKDYVDYAVQLLGMTQQTYATNNPEHTEIVIEKLRQRSSQVSVDTYSQKYQFFEGINCETLQRGQLRESEVMLGYRSHDVLSTYLCWFQHHSAANKLEKELQYWMKVESSNRNRVRYRYIETIPWKYIEHSIVYRLRWPHLLFPGDHPFELALLQPRLPQYSGGGSAKIEDPNRHPVDLSYMSRLSELALRIDSEPDHIRKLRNFDNAFGHLKNLRTLSLVCGFREGVHYITGDLFQYLPHLRELQLRPERCDFTANSFQYLSNLTLLDLDARFREDLCNKFGFAHLYRLRSLKLRRVPQGRMINDIFLQLTNLTSLDIRDDEIRQLQNISLGPMRSNLRRLTMNLQAVEDQWFEGLSNLTYLDIAYSARTSLTKEAFKHLSSLSCLNMEACSQAGINDAAFEHLPELRDLNMGRCNQNSITDAAFSHLPLLTRLRMDGCKQSTITDCAFSHSRRLLQLNVSDCGNITNSAFQYFSNLEELDMTACHQNSITDEAFKHLSSLKRLRMGGCHNTDITDEAFRHLRNVTKLYMSECNQKTITDEAFRHLDRVQCLVMNSCYQTTITDEAFRHLSSVKELHMQWCRQLTITDAAFKHLSNVKILDVERCDQTSISEEAFRYLPKLQELNVKMSRVTTSGIGIDVRLPDVEFYY